MPDTYPSTDGPDIGLAEMIENLRSELESALEKGTAHSVAFEIDKVELELKVAVSRKLKGEGGVAFWVVKAGAGLEAGRDSTHTFKLTLMPVVSASGARLKVGSRSREAPTRG